MVNSNHYWFFFAFILTMAFHLLAISPLATWLNRSLMPAWTDTGIEIDLTEIKARTEKERTPPQLQPPPVTEKSNKAEPLTVPKPEPEEKTEPEPVPIPELEPEEKTEPEPVPIPEPESEPLVIPESEPQQEKILNPAHKKVLDPTLQKDVIVKPEKDQPEKPSPDRSTGSKKQDTGKPVGEKKQDAGEDTGKKESSDSTSPPGNITQSPAARPEKIVTEPPALPEDEKKGPELKEESDGPGEGIVSPLFIKKPREEPGKTPSAPAAGDEDEKVALPEEITKTFRDGEPEKTEEETLEFSMNSYRWTFERYMENWAYDIQKWWKPPLDYAMGKIPEGGNMWIQVELAKSGKLLGYRIVKSDITAEMELMVVQALVGSLARPAMPASFPEKSLIINWHFIYPPLRPEIDLRR